MDWWWQLGWSFIIENSGNIPGNWNSWYRHFCHRSRQIGLPPSPEEVEAFVGDSSPDAFAKVVDRLLDSPRYGERWARHWLDVARYADTKGYVFEEERRYAYAYTYRDYVIRAFNEDLPFDRFIVEQLAADRLGLGDDKRAGADEESRHFLFFSRLGFQVD